MSKQLRAYLKECIPAIVCLLLATSMMVAYKLGINGSWEIFGQSTNLAEASVPLVAMGLIIWGFAVTEYKFGRHESGEQTKKQ